MCLLLLFAVQITLWYTACILLYVINLGMFELYSIFVLFCIRMWHMQVTILNTEGVLATLPQRGVYNISLFTWSFVVTPAYLLRNRG